MSERHLIIAYVVTWVIQLGYLGWVVLKWRSLKQLEAKSPAYPEQP